MTIESPGLLAVGVVAAVVLVALYLWLQHQRSAALVASGLSPVGAPRVRTELRRHLPYALFLAAAGLLLLAPAGIGATIATPHRAGTVILAVDVSNSMGADDLAPTRLAAAQAAAIRFVAAQPASMDIGVVAFGQGALLTQAPTADHDAVAAALGRLAPRGDTSLVQGILTSLGAIVGRPVSLPTGSAPPDLGYWGSATIVLISDGEDTTDTDVLAAAALAAAAGVHIETVGIGTPQGAVIDVDGFQVATALNEQLLVDIAAATSGSYHPAADAAALDRIYDTIDLRLTFEDRPLELTGVIIATALVLLTGGGLLMIFWFGRIV